MQKPVSQLFQQKNLTKLQVKKNTKIEKVQTKQELNYFQRLCFNSICKTKKKCKMKNGNK